MSNWENFLGGKITMGMTGKITKIYVKFESEKETLFNNGTYYAAEVPEGADVNLYIEFETDFPDKGLTPWSVGTSVSGINDSKTDNSLIFPTFDNFHSYHVGIMPANNLNLGIIKLWGNRASTWQDPPTN
jgi:hypothetical protein